MHGYPAKDIEDVYRSIKGVCWVLPLSAVCTTFVYYVVRALGTALSAVLCWWEISWMIWNSYNDKVHLNQHLRIACSNI